MENVSDEHALHHSTTLTNKQRGNELTVRPATLDSKSWSQPKPICNTKSFTERSHTSQYPFISSFIFIKCLIQMRFAVDPESWMGLQPIAVYFPFSTSLRAGSEPVPNLEPVIDIYSGK